MVLSSIIKDFDAKGLKYIATSLSFRNINEGPENVFSNGTSKYFVSQSSPSDQWWQVEFENPVPIGSYVIQSQKSFTSHVPTKWIINISNDGNSWKTVQETGKSSTEDTEPCVLPKTVNCKFFQIVLKENAQNNDNIFVMQYFDCFGEIANIYKNKLRSCMNQNRKYRMTYNFVMLVGSLLLN